MRILRGGGDNRFTLFVEIIVIWLTVLPRAAYCEFIIRWSIQWGFSVSVGLAALLKVPLYTKPIHHQTWLKYDVKNEYIY